jgi:hypothetical protein
MTKLIRSTIVLVALAAFCSLLPSVALAQQDEDPPGRVGRLNFIQGSISYQVQGDSDWVAADPNRPLTTGDNLWADNNSRGEVHIQSAAIRLSRNTGISFLNLDDRTVQLQLAQGTIEVHLRQLAPGEAFEVDTPNLSFTPTRAGEYVVSTDPDGNSTHITVREGEADVTGGGDSWGLRAGQQYTFNGTDQLSYDAQRAPYFDDFEAWCQERDQRENNSASARYVSRDVDGYYDLDDYGDWNQDGDYGAVWYPRSVAVDWVPYHAGHWVYIAPWGWTWVDSEPWGFAPFHYGRWILVRDRWGWVPGPVVERPVYAPALVGFVGGAGFGVSITIGGGFSGVAWFPLGPRDVFVPGYRCSPHYVQVVNVTNTRVVNVTQVTNVYNTVVINRDVRRVNYTYDGNSRAVTAVRHDTFVNARPVDRESVHVNDDQMRNVRVVSNVAIAPTRSSYRSSTATVSNARPAVPFSQRPVVANLPPRVPIQNPRGPQNNQPNDNRNNNGFRGFGPQGNNGNNNGPRGIQQQPGANRGPAAANGVPNNSTPNNGAPNNSPPRTFNQPMQPTRGPATTQGGPPNTPNNNGAPNNPNNAAPTSKPPRTLEEQGTPQPPPNQQNSPQSGGFRPFNAPNGGNPQGPRGNPGAPDNNHTPPQVIQNGNPGNNQNQNQNPNQNQNQQRYRFSPPVKANDNNYDIHPPLNQNRPDNNPRPENQPRQEAQPRPAQNPPPQAQPRPEEHPAPPPRDNKPDNKNDNSDKKNH